MLNVVPVLKINPLNRTLLPTTIAGVAIGTVADEVYTVMAVALLNEANADPLASVNV
jgi:hypothetical protein